MDHAITYRQDREGSPTGGALPPERRIEAIAEIFARGLARLLLAEQGDVSASFEAARPPEFSSGSPLIERPNRALMSRRRDNRGAAEGGHSR